MFESLNEQIKDDELKALSNRERILRWTLIVLVSVIVFGAVYLGVHLLDGR
jgi:membrane-associated phospholipid phosphatase